MHVILHKNFDNDVERYASSNLRDAIIKFLDVLEKAENLSEIGGIKKLSGFTNIYRYRIRDYRIGLRIKRRW